MRQRPGVLLLPQAGIGAALKLPADADVVDLHERDVGRACRARGDIGRERGTAFQPRVDQLTAEVPEAGQGFGERCDPDCRRHRGQRHRTARHLAAAGEQAQHHAVIGRGNMRPASGRDRRVRHHRHRTRAECRPAVDEAQAPAAILAPALRDQRHEARLTHGRPHPGGHRQRRIGGEQRVVGRGPTLDADPALQDADVVRPTLRQLRRAGCGYRREGETDHREHATTTSACVPKATRARLKVSAARVAS